MELLCFSKDVVISVLHLRGFVETDSTITVECGMHTKVLARMMVNKGSQGFEELIDLSGTVFREYMEILVVSYGCLIQRMLIYVKVLTLSGDIVDYSKMNLDFKINHQSMKMLIWHLRSI